MAKADLPRPAPAGQANRSVPRVTLQGRGETLQLHLAAEGDPVVSPEAAAVLARIVKSLRVDSTITT